jgi:glycosyltransferase involved in cell wall biosynthesis
MSRNEARRPLRVLYIHHIGPFGGASRSLLEMLLAFPAGAVEPRLLVARGSAADLFEQHGFGALRVPGISRYDTTSYGHYRGLRWLILLRELYLLPPTLLGLWRARRRWRDIDLIHINDVTVLGVGLAAKALFRKPLVVHARSVQKQSGPAIRLMQRLLERRADAVLAIDETVRASLPPSVPVRVVHNGFSPTPVREASPPVERLRSSLHPGSLRVGMVGTLLALKGVFEFLEAARLVLGQGANVDFVLVGSNTRRLGGRRERLLRQLGFAQDMESGVERFVATYGLGERVHRVEFVADVSSVYESLDVLCFPSHLDAIGRPVIEAAWHSLPSIAAVSEPRADTFVPGETGLQIPARDPQALAQAILRLERNRPQLERMGAAARRLAERNFDSRKNAARVLEIYRALRR